MRKTCLFLLIAMVVVIGCREGDVETGGVLGEKISPKTDLVVAGELRQVTEEEVPGAPAFVAEPVRVYRLSPKRVSWTLVGTCQKTQKR